MNRTELNKHYRVKHTPFLINRIKLVKIIQLSEKEFAELIKEIENDTLFKKLSSFDGNYKIIKREQFPNASLSSKFYELKEEITPDKSLLDLELILKNHKECISIIRKIGEDKFRQYFLFDKLVLSQEDLASKCNLDIEEVKKINNMLDEISIYNEFCYPSIIDHRMGIHYTKIASIEKDDSENFAIKFFSPNFIRGKYKVDYKKLAELKHNRVFTKEERKQINKLLHNLELINSRKSIIYQIIWGIIERQKSFLVSGNEEDIVSFKQKDLAAKIDINPGLICRAINGRSIVTPQGCEKPVKYFFPSNKEIRKRIVEKIILNEKESLTDERIKIKLKEEYGLDISRRSIAASREELKIVSSSKRKPNKNKRRI